MIVPSAPVELAESDRSRSGNDGSRRSRPRPIRWLREHPTHADLLLAVLATAVALALHLGQFDTAETYVEPAWWTVPLIILATFPIAWRRTRPIESTIIVVTTTIVITAIDIEGGGFIGVLIALYSLGAHSSGPQRARVLYGTVCGIGLLFVAGLVVDELGVADFISSVVVLVTAFVLGDNLRRRRDAAHALEERLQRAERERELVAEQKVAAERTRIARELHDVVAHSVSVMVIQAGAARRSLSSSPENAEIALSNVETTGRQTMDELRSMLGVLRHEQTEKGESPDPADDGLLAPQPRLSHVETLIAAATDLPVELVVSGDLSDLSPGVDLTGFRIVQESLTNVRRHAGPVTRVEVAVVRTVGSVEVQISDDGRGAAADVDPAGFGLVGMSERVDAVGGTVAAGWRRGGGWIVTATLPAPPPATDEVVPDPVREPSEANSWIRVMLVDDQSMVRTGFRMILEAEADLTVVGEACNGREAIDLVQRAAPDVILMDVRMPDVDGIEACEKICASDASARVMMLTTFDLDDYVHAALRAGASGFLLKDAPPEQLVDAIRVIASGDALLAPAVTQTLIDEIARRPAGQPDEFPGIDRLTERESDVIRLMARGQSNAEIAVSLYLGEATVKTHVGRILAKLGARDRVQAVVAAFESGLVTPGSSSTGH